MATSIVQFRIDDKLKSDAAEIYEKLGLDLSTAVRMFLKRSVAVNGIPFSMVLPDEPYSAKKALQSVAEMNASAAQYGIEDMPLDEINAEIAAYRKERRTRGSAE